MTEIKNKEENGGLDRLETGNNKFNSQITNNMEENGNDGKIYKYTNYSSPCEQRADRSRQTDPTVSSPGKGVHQGGTDLTHHQSHTEKDLPGDKEMAALSPIHRLLERNAIRNAAGTISAPDETPPNAPCSKLTSVRRPNQVTSGWI